MHVCKGAVPAVMALCHTDASGRKNIEDVIRSFAGRGLRTVAVAEDVSHDDDDDDDNNNNNSSSSSSNNNANASYYILRDRNVLNRVRRGERLASEAVRDALLLVRVRVVGRGTVDYNAALCAPSTALLSSLAPLSSRSSLLHADTRSQHAAASCAVIGRITSDRAVSLTHGCGAGIGCISLVQWLDLRQRLDRFTFCFSFLPSK